MPDPCPSLCGVPFMPLHHHDGRFVRVAGLFAFARRNPDGGYVVLHLELTEAINRTGVSGHPRWAWALGEGMNTLLVHMAGREASQANGPEAAWHPLAQVVFAEGDLSLPAEMEAEVGLGPFRRTARF